MLRHLPLRQVVALHHALEALRFLDRAEREAVHVLVQHGLVHSLTVALEDFQYLETSLTRRSLATVSRQQHPGAIADGVRVLGVGLEEGASRHDQTRLQLPNLPHRRRQLGHITHTRLRILRVVRDRIQR